MNDRLALLSLLAFVAAACSGATPPQAQCPCACASAPATAVGAASAGASPASSAVGASASRDAGTSTQGYSDHELAAEHAENARVKMGARDGAGCLAELDEHDKLDPRHPSTEPKHGHVAFTRAQCLMLAGKCSAGRDLMKRTSEIMQGATSSPQQIDTMVDAMAGMYCEGEMTPRDRFLRARMDLQTGAWTATKDVAFCTSAYKTLWTLRATVKPRGDDDALVKDPLPFMLTAAPACLARAGDCGAAFATYGEVARELYAGKSWANDPTQLRTTFDSMQPKCKR
jgi:hypothetical protein